MKMVTFNGNSLAKIVKGNSVNFAFYRKGELWYELKFEENILQFPVPISDTGDACFMNTDKATLFLRYIRKHLETIEKEKEKY